MHEGQWQMDTRPDLASVELVPKSTAEHSTVYWARTQNRAPNLGASVPILAQPTTLPPSVQLYITEKQRDEKKCSWEEAKRKREPFPCGTLLRIGDRAC